MKCILHIGTEKTGTTSLQSFFNINRDLLISNQIYYLKSPGLTNHRIVPVLFYPDDYIDDFRIIYDLKDESVFNTWKEKNLNFLNKELNVEISNEKIDIFEIAKKKYPNENNSIDNLKKKLNIINNSTFSSSLNEVLELPKILDKLS